MCRSRGRCGGGVSTACIATLDLELNQLSFSNVGDNGIIIMRHIDSDVAGYMRDKTTPRPLRTNDLRIAFVSRQQVRPMIQTGAAISAPG
jgi:protein phosphatase PTC7